MNGSGKLTIGDPGYGRFHMGDEVDLLIFTRFREVNFISGPGNRAFIAKTRFWVVGRIKVQPGRREIFGFAPTELPLLYRVLKYPRLSQRLDGRKFSQVGRG